MMLRCAVVHVSRGSLEECVSQLEPDLEVWLGFQTAVTFEEGWASVVGDGN
jgi:hypothetical protein